MFENSRLNEILEYFLTNQGYTPAAKLSQHFQISERTLRNNIKEINEKLSIYQTQILIKRKEGYYLYMDDPAVLSDLEQSVNKEKNLLDSVEKRIHHLIVKLLYAKSYLTQNDLADEVFVSINTIINYIKTIRANLSRYNLTLKAKANMGYIIVGNELDKRRCIIDLLSSDTQQYALQFSNDQQNFLKDVNLNLVKDILIDFNQEHNLRFSDYNLKNLILHVAVSISRLRHNMAVTDYHIAESLQVNQFFRPLIDTIEMRFHVSVTETERDYLCSLYVNNTFELLDTEFTLEYAQNLTQDILMYIYEYYHIDLRTDPLILRDLSRHLQAILNTRYLSLNNKNPLLNTIKTNYILAFEVTQTALFHIFENEPFHLNEDDIGYVALYIESAMERYFDSHYIHRKRAIILYGHGYAEGSFLSSKVKTLFKNVLEVCGHYPSHELDKLDLSDIDLIISSVPVSAKNNIPVIDVNIPLLRQDIENISKEVSKKNQHPISKIMDLFSPSLFVRTKVNEKNEVIHILSQLLYKEGYVEEHFEQSVLERESKITTDMDDMVALPHPLSMLSTKSRVAVALLEEPVKWSETHNAQIIFLLSLADDNNNDIKILYNTFVGLIHDPVLENTLLKAESVQEFLQMLKENIDEDYY